MPSDAQVYFTFTSLDVNEGIYILNEGTLPFSGRSVGGGPVVPGGILGNCISLPFDYSCVSLDYIFGVDISAAAGWTLSVWVKDLAPDTQFRTLYRGFDASLGHHPVAIQPGSDELGTFENGAQIFYPSGATVSSFTPGMWHHITAVGGGGETKIYINGTLAGTSAFVSDTDIWVVGNFQYGGQLFASYMDELRIWGRALTDVEVQTLHQTTLCLASRA